MLTHALLGLPVWWLGAALLLALAIDRLWGEPPVRLHPVVWMGNYLAWAGEHLQRVARPWEPGGAEERPDWAAFAWGTVAWVAGAVLVLAVSWGAMVGLQALAGAAEGGAGGGEVWRHAVSVLLLALLLKPLLAWAMLRTEVLAVEAALSGPNGSLAAGRERLSWLVSRDVTQLSEAGVRESAIESLAENLSDSVVAPLFWFVLLGLPAAAVYRLANTADAMWGYRGSYRGKTWEWAGKWAARADDVLNWIPARLTAVALWAAGVWQARPAGCAGLHGLAQEAAQTPSPNSGWPMAAMALALDVSLRKPGVYTLHAAGQAPAAAATAQAVGLAGRALFVLVVALLVLGTLGLLWLGKGGMP